MLLRAKQTFEEKWEQAQATRSDPSDEALGWTDVEDTARAKFIQGALKALDDEDTTTRIASLECLSYIALGGWVHTAGIESALNESKMENESPSSADGQYSRSGLQLRWIRKGVGLLAQFGAFQKLLDILSHLSEIEQSVSPLHSKPTACQYLLIY